MRFLCNWPHKIISSRYIRTGRLLLYSMNIIISIMPYNQRSPNRTYKTMPGRRLCTFPLCGWGAAQSDRFTEILSSGQEIWDWKEAGRRAGRKQQCRKTTRQEFPSRITWHRRKNRRSDGSHWADHQERCPIFPRGDLPGNMLCKMELPNRCNWQRSEKNIYLASRIIFTCYYNRNKTETVLASKLKQASSGYYPSRIYRIDKNCLKYSDLQAYAHLPVRPLPKVTIADYWRIFEVLSFSNQSHGLTAIVRSMPTIQSRP